MKHCGALDLVVNCSGTADRSDMTDSTSLLARIEAEQKQLTGIPKLRVGYNRVFGYYIEVTKSYLNMVPETYTRRQTLANAERFVTPELKELEQKAGVDDITMAQRPGWLTAISWIFVLLALLPCWLVSLWPHAICYSMPPRLIHTDKMFTNSYRFIMSVLFLYPFFALLTMLVMGISWGLWWQALVWILLWVPLGKFGWWYYQRLRQTKRALCFLLQPHHMRTIEAIRSIINKIITI